MQKYNFLFIVDCSKLACLILYYTILYSTLLCCIITKAPREGASFITSQSELGVIGRGAGVGQNWWVFSAIPHLELGKTLLPKRLVLGQISVLLGKWLFRRPKEKQASSDAADAGLACRLMLLMLVVCC